MTTDGIETGGRWLMNPWRGGGLPAEILAAPDFARGEIERDPDGPLSLFQHCPRADRTPLRPLPDAATALGIGSLVIKDERSRMGLGSFKALGAAHAIARRACPAGTVPTDPATSLTGQTFICASAGNHGLSVAAGARAFGARAVIVLAQTVPEDFADRLRDRGADVVRAGAVYADSMAAAQRLADDNGWQLLADSTWPGYVDPARDVMAGYLIMGAEIAEQWPESGQPPAHPSPTHVFLQAGVGGLACALAASVRRFFGDTPRICVVEPVAAPALIDSIEAGRPVVTAGPASNMGRLDCKEPSHLALRALAADADAFMTVTDAQATETVDWLRNMDLPTTPSGGAGIAGLRYAPPALRTALGLDATSCVLAILSEGPTDG